MIITRKGTFDAGHRVMHQTQACRNLHGHLYQYELSFLYKEEEEIGYAIDFKEIKRIAGDFIDEHFDHGFIVNPHDTTIIETLDKLESKKWVMSLNGGNFCNPTAENIAKELFIIIQCLLNDRNLKLSNIRLYETPSCFVDCTANNVRFRETVSVLEGLETYLKKWREEKGSVIYDDRKL